MLVLLVALFPVHGARGQSSAPASAPARSQVVLGAHEDALWIARVSDGQSQLTHRLRGAAFETPIELARSIAVLCPVQADGYAAFRDGGLYRFGTSDATGIAERDLPKQRVPLSLIADGAALLALLPPEVGPGENDPPAQPLRVVRYNGREWSIVAECDVAERPSLSGRTRSRILLAGDKLLLAWVSDEKIYMAWRPLAGGNWTRGSPIAVPGIAGFWLLDANESPTLLAAIAGESEGEQLRSWRLSNVDALEWRPVNLTFPEGGATGVGKFEDAAGFNQQFALIVRDKTNAPILTFVREGQAPTEPPVSVDALFDLPARANELQDIARMVTFALLVLLLVGLFTFRRESMTEPAVLPADLSLAFSSQRLLAGVLDLAPFALSAAYATKVDIVDGFKSLLNWGLFHGPGVPLPSQAVVTWWVLTAVGFTVYCLIMEVALGRTIGKLIAGTRVRAKGGGRAGFVAVLVRNAFRLLEMIPQFWIFAFLIVLSRNRQRLGDVFANTYVVRSAKPGPSAPENSK